MVNHPKYVSGRKVILAFCTVFVAIGIVIADRLVYLRKLTLSGSAMKGIAAVYFGCERMIVLTQPMTGDWLIQFCQSKSSEDFVREAKRLTIFPNGCIDKSVVAWAPELHYWAENWMPIAPVAGRFVLFEDKRWSFVKAAEFSRLGCP